MKNIHLKPYLFAFGGTFLFSLVVYVLFFINWGKFHYGDQQVKTVYVDSSKHKSAESIVSHIDSSSLSVPVPFSKPTKHKKRVQLPHYNDLMESPSGSKKDTTSKSKYDLHGAILSQSAVGDNAHVDIHNEEIVLHPTTELIKKITDSAIDKHSLIYIKYETSQAFKNRTFSMELKQKLNDLGYTNISVSDPTNITNWGVPEKTVIIKKSGNNLILFVTEY